MKITWVTSTNNKEESKKRKCQLYLKIINFESTGFMKEKKIDVKKNNTLVEPRGKANLELDRR